MSKTGDCEGRKRHEFQNFAFKIDTFRRRFTGTFLREIRELKVFTESMDITLIDGKQQSIS